MKIGSKNIMKPIMLVLCLCLSFLLLVSCTSVGNANAELTETDVKEAIDSLNSQNGSEYIAVSFPGLNIGWNQIAKSPIVFGSLNIHWYGILIVCGIILAFVYSYLLFRKKSYQTDDLLDMAIWSIVASIVGARLYYVIFSLDRFLPKTFDFESIKDFIIGTISVWDGGLAIYGGIIGGIIAVWAVCRKKKIDIFNAMDILGPAVMIGQIIGRFGNFANGEAFGSEVSEKSALYFARMGLYSNSTVAAYKDGILSSRIAYVHPTFLYESLWNLVGFALINIICYAGKKKAFKGQAFFMYIAWYGFGRTFIELLRTDSLMIFGTVRVSSLLGIICFFFGVAMLILFGIKGKKERLAGEEYKSVYTEFHTSFSDNESEKIENNGTEEENKNDDN